MFNLARILKMTAFVAGGAALGAGLWLLLPPRAGSETRRLNRASRSRHRHLGARPFTGTQAISMAERSMKMHRLCHTGTPTTRLSLVRAL